MSRRPQTEIAILGALSIGPMTGYELRAAITDVLGDFWHESFGQIYPTLATLEESGSVRRATPGRTSGSRFEITSAGRAVLRERLAEPHTAPPPRNALLLRLFFGSELPPGRAAELLRAEIDRATTALGRFAAIRTEVVAEPESEARTFRSLTLSYGEHHARAHLTWAREALAALPQDV